MDVRLLSHTPEPERAIAAAARLCYAPVGAAELLETMSDDAVHRVLKTIITSGHTSALEHASYTFAIDGVSRALTHQLVRHRLASYNQQSQRYVSYAEEPALHRARRPSRPTPRRSSASRRPTPPPSRPTARCSTRAMPAEDARYLLPNAMETKIVVTMNIRELLHFFELRCCKRAQWEIRDLALAHARTRRAHRPLHLHGRRRVVPSRPVPRGQDDVRRPLPEGTQT